MTFRARLLAAIVLILVVAFGAAFVAVAGVIGRTERAQLDAALLDDAHRQARAVSPGGALGPAPDAAPSADDVAPRVRYVALYDRGRVVAQGFAPGAPALASIRHAPNRPFDLWLAGEHLRCVFAPVAARPDAVLLVAAPRTDLDADARLLARVAAAAFVLAVAWAALVVHWTVRRLTRDLDRIARTATRVAGGDLASRSGVPAARRDEIARLAHDVDAMIARLEALVAAQQRFVADAAHELRSPLTALYGELTLALHRDPDATGYRRAIEHGVAATEDLVRLAEDLLVLARLGARGAREAARVETTGLIDAAVAALRREADERGVAIEREGDGATVHGRAGELERLLRNVLENALRHAPRGSRVRIATRLHDGRVVIAIADQGPGVPADVRERIFEPFYRGPRERSDEIPGAGLGLAIAREVARSHGGDVTVTDAPGDARGACFTIALPGVPNDARGTAAA